MVQAIIFDCFGVLVRDGWLPLREHYFERNSEKMHQARELNRQTNSSLLTYNEFIHQVAELAGVSDDTIRQELENNPSNTRLFEWMRDDLKPHYKIGLLSNAGAYWLDDLFEPWQVELFDATLLSYEVGTTKPDPVLYKMIADRLGCLPEECLFIDDQERYCIGARDVGMQAICYEDNAQLADSFKNYNILLNYN